MQTSTTSVTYCSANRIAVLHGLRCTQSKVVSVTLICPLKLLYMANVVSKNVNMSHAFMFHVGFYQGLM